MATKGPYSLQICLHFFISGFIVDSITIKVSVTITSFSFFSAELLAGRGETWEMQCGQTSAGTCQIFHQILLNKMGKYRHQFGGSALFWWKNKTTINLEGSSACSTQELLPLCPRSLLFLLHRRSYPMELESVSASKLFFLLMIPRWPGRCYISGMWVFQWVLKGCFQLCPAHHF